MIKVLPVGILEPVGKILKLLLIDTLEFLLPSEFLVTVHESEIEKVSSRRLVYQVSIIIEIAKIFVEV